jgi:small conductance mechanosensitive channel
MGRILRARQEIELVLAAHPKVLKELEKAVSVNGIAPLGVELVVRCWVRAGDYQQTYYDVMEGVKSVLDKLGISIPYPAHEMIPQMRVQ